MVKIYYEVFGLKTYYPALNLGSLHNKLYGDDLIPGFLNHRLQVYYVLPGRLIIHPVVDHVVDIYLLVVMKMALQC